MAEVIITEFIAETGQFVASIDKAEAAVMGLEQAEKNAQKSTAALTNQLGSSSAKANAHRAVMAEVGKSAASAATNTTKLAQSVKSVSGAAPSLGKVRDEFSKVASSAGEASASAGGLGGKIMDAASQAVPAVGGVTGSFLGMLGPIGVAAGAAAGALLGIVRNTDAGATALDGLRRSAGFVFDRITGLAKSAWSAISSAFGESGIPTLFGRIELSAMALIGVLGPVPALLAKVFGSELDAGREIAEQLDELRDKQLGVNEATALNEIAIRRNLSALRDTTKPIEERLKLADEITRLENDNLRAKQAQLRAEYMILAAQAGRQQALKTEIDDTLKAQLSSIRTQIFDLEAESVSLTERVASRRAGIVEAEEQRKKAAREKSAADAAKIRAKALADEQKAANDAKKRIADTIAAEDAIAEVQSAIILAGLGETARRDAAVRASFEKQIEVARAAFAELSRLATSDSEREEIAKREAQAIIDADAAMKAELERLRQQDITGVRAYGATKQKLQEDEINKRFDLRRSDTEKLIESEEERTAILAQIERDRAEELAAIREDAAAKERERQIEDAQAVLDSSRNLGQSLIAIDNAITSNRIADIDARIAAAKREGKDTTELEKEREREQKEAARRAFQINRAFTLAQIAVDTARAISALVAASAANPTNAVTFGAAGAAQFAAGLIQITANIASAIALLSQKAPGFARGGEVDAGWGPKTRRANGDNVLATLQDREIVLSRASRARAERMFGRGVWGELGVPGFGGSVDWTNALARVGAANADRNGGSSIVQQRDDRRIIGALGSVGSLREQRRQTELLEELARMRGRNPRSRWA